MNKERKFNQIPEYEAWRTVCKQDNLIAYMQFLSQYPHSKYRKKAYKRRLELEEKKAWASVKHSHRIYSYEKFLDNYPDGQYAALAGKRIKDLEKKAKKNTQDTTEVAKHLLWEEKALEEASSIDSIAAYNHFLKNFPKSEYQNQIIQRMHQLESRLAVQYRFLEIEMQNWEFANKLNTAYSYGQFLKKFPDGKFARLAKERLEKLGVEVEGKATPKKTEPEQIRVDPNDSPLLKVLQDQTQKKKVEEKSALGLAYAWLVLFTFNTLAVYFWAPVFLHFITALALLSAGYFMYTRSNSLNNKELSIYGYGICLAIWISAKEIMTFLSFSQASSWVFSSLFALGALLLLIKNVDGWFGPQQEDEIPSDMP